MNKPTDAEIIALNAGEIHFSESPTKYPEAGHGTQYHAGAHGVLSFARAVLAKWGTPAPVGVEPVARLEIGKTKGGVSLTHIAEPAAFQLQEGMYALYTAPQPTQTVPPAGREPLTDAQIAEMMRDTWGCASIAPRHALEFARVVERAHGIKGGQHGAE